MNDGRIGEFGYFGILTEDNGETKREGEGLGDTNHTSQRNRSLRVRQQDNSLVVVGVFPFLVPRSIVASHRYRNRKPNLDICHGKED